jgi:hypothetical protein
MSHPLAIIEYQQTCWYQITKQILEIGRKTTMSNITIPAVGSQFTTLKSGVSGIVQEVVANKNGSFRVRLEVAGQDRWSTIK